MKALFLGIAIFALVGLIIPMSVSDVEAHKGKSDTVCVFTGFVENPDGTYSFPLKCSQPAELGDAALLITKDNRFHVDVAYVSGDKVGLSCDHFIPEKDGTCSYILFIIFDAV